MKKIFILLIFILYSHLTWSQNALLFIENKGQWADQFNYKASHAAGDVFIKHDGFRVLLEHNDNSKLREKLKHGDILDKVIFKYHAYEMKWLNSNKDVHITTQKQESFYYNYFLGNDPSKWADHIYPGRALAYSNLYNGIDARMTSSSGNLKIDYIVKPHADPTQIQIQVNGADELSVQNNRLHVKTSVGNVIELEPYTYQIINDEKKVIPTVYSLNGNVIRFDFPKGYNKNYELIIDPEISFASLTGSVSDNWGFTATFDSGGNLYGGGIVSGNDYPTSLGAFQSTYAGGTSGSSMPCDIGISKFTSDGTALAYSTFIGGTLNDYPHSMFVDNSGNLYVSGKTSSSNFPTTAGSYDPTHNGGFDIFVLKLNNTGSALTSSTYIGGSGDDGINIDAEFAGDITTLKYNYGDNARSEILLDNIGNVYIASASKSTNFPLVNPTKSSITAGDQDGVIIKLNNELSSLIWSTYLGGSGNDAAYVIAFNNSYSHLYVAGGTQSSDFMSSTTSSGFWNTYQGGTADGFIVKYNNSGTYSVAQKTFIGTTTYDQVFGIQVDKNDNVYVMGQTLGPFPVTTGTYSVASSRQFIMKLNPDLNTNIFSTVWGIGATTKPNIVPVAFLVDTCEQIYISGWGGTISGSVMTGLPTTPDALQPSTDGNDFYFIVFQTDATDLLYASYFGASGKSEHVDGGTSRFDPTGAVYQAICASCGPGSSAYPSTSGAYASTKGSTTTNCNLGVLKINFNLTSVKADAVAGPDTAGCAPFTVTFSNSSTSASSYIWNFGDGSPISTTASPTHTYNTPGTYTVTLIAENEGTCMNSDTTHFTIVVTDNDMKPDFNFNILDSCTTFSVSFTNTSVGSSPSAVPSYIWVFGDGTDYSGVTPPVHNFPGAGTYTVMLIMTDPEACNSPDTISKTITFTANLVEADFIGGNFCSNDNTVDFSNSSTNATDYIWDFGDGNTSSDTNPSHSYMAPGSYNVTLISSNPGSCNKSDTIQQTINIHPSPTANFYFTPLIPETNTPTQFHNTSSGAVSYNWTFGDGNNSTAKDPLHQYMRTGEYRVCLTARNEFDCVDTICKNVRAEVLPLLDLPTAFTPNGDGNNDILYPRGYAVQTVNLKIFNRWGELVFESHSMNTGWNGQYKGVDQPMDSYAYVLTATFADGTNYSKQGNVTLIR